MTSSSSMTSKSYKNAKKVDEVKEVIQNKPDADIVKVLEFYDNDVAKTINAFMNDGGKEAMSKWNMKKQQKNKAADSSATDGVAVGQKASNETNNRQSNGRKPKPTDNRNNQTGSDSKNNINDLVSSIINQYTAVTAESKEPAAKPVVAAKLNGDNPLHSHQQNLLNSLNNLIISSNSGNASKSIGGLKVTVIGIEQPGKQVELQQQASSVGASPASASPSSSGSVLSSSSSLIKQAPQLLQRPQPALNIPNIDLAYVNPNNSKSSMDKFQKDLHRQTTVLAKISAQFQEELHKSQLDCNQTFERLRHLLNERQSQMQAEFGLMARNASQMLSSRQNKAVQLKLLADNAVHLNDNDTLELKADIKHFVSERQLDEEFLKHRLFQADEADKIAESLKTLGTVAHLDIQYATKRPSAEELFKNSFSSTASSPSQTKAVSEEKPVGNKFSVKITDVNGFEDYGEAVKNEGEFIEVKKPQRNKNKKAAAPIEGNISNDLNNNSKNPVVANGKVQVAAPKPNGNVKKPLPQRIVDEPQKPINKRNVNSFSIIANGHN